MREGAAETRLPRISSNRDSNNPTFWGEAKVCCHPTGSKWSLKKGYDLKINQC